MGSFSTQPSGILGGKGLGLGLPSLGTTESKELAIAGLRAFRGLRRDWGKPIIIVITFSLFPFFFLSYIYSGESSSPEEETNTNPRHFSQIICLYPEILDCLKDILPESFLDLGFFFGFIFCHVTYFPSDTEQKATSQFKWLGVGLISGGKQIYISKNSVIKILHVFIFLSDNESVFVNVRCFENSIQIE